MAGLIVVLQLVPYGWSHPNPAVTQDAPWPNEEVASLARGACYDCHSNETDWPVYAYVAPISWMVRRDVEAGRAKLNFSEWGTDAGETDDAGDELADGKMPPLRFRLLHSGARLSPEQRQTILPPWTSWRAMMATVAVGAREAATKELAASRNRPEPFVPCRGDGMLVQPCEW